MQCWVKRRILCTSTLTFIDTGMKPETSPTGVAAQRLSFKRTLSTAAQQNACHYLAECTGLSKARVKDAMLKGAVWLSKKGGGRRRLRRASAALRVGDTVEIHYDPALLAIDPAVVRCVDDRRRYSVWFKPARVMSQGTNFGDHCALPRQVDEPSPGATGQHRDSEQQSSRLP